MWAGFVGVGLKHGPFRCLKDAMRLKQLMDGNVQLGPQTYAADHTHIRPAFETTLLGDPFDRRNTPQAAPKPAQNAVSRADAVFYANPVYHEGNQHIDEFDAETCLKCIIRYEAQHRETPCVSDCTAEVHRVDVREQARVHGMSLENCIQCRTCEIVCPEQNLRVRPTEQGSGPDFMGL